MLSKYTGENRDVTSTLSNYVDFIRDLPTQTNVDDIADFWKDAQAVRIITVLDMPIFKCDESDFVSLLEETSIDASDYAPEVECCLTCMPYENEEVVEISSERGSVEELTTEEVSTNYPDIPWHMLTIDIDTPPQCEGCGCKMESDSIVYHAINEGPNDID